jgi:site-specific recombinase XerD
MAGSFGVRLSGPLEGFAEGFAAELVGLGYSRRGGEGQLRLMAHVSRWMSVQGLAAGDLTAEAVERFVVARRASYRGLRSARALVPMLGYLRALGVVPRASVIAATDPAEVLLERFGRYLARERGLAGSTVDSYVSQVRPFVREHGAAGWGELTVRQVAVFVTVRSLAQPPRSVAVRANALRCLLRWMWREGLVSSRLLPDAVGKIAAPTGNVPPRALTAAELESVVAGLSAGSVRVRDEAMLALMWRLGLRAGEVACLRLDDVNWREGIVLVRGKRARRDQLPLPVDLGNLLSRYLSRGRPHGSAHREVFLALDAPHGPLSSAAVSSVAARALAAAGIAGGGGAHRLRHTAACGVLAAGGGLIEVGQLLRHASPETSAIYARSDQRALAVLARPWPTGAGR